MLCLWTWLVFVAAARADLMCNARRTSSLQFGVRTEINETGQRIVTVEMQGSFQEPLGVFVAHWTATCGTARVVAVRMNASVSDAKQSTDIPPAKASNAGDAASTAAAPICIPGYREWDGVGCYKFHAAEMTWEQAWEFCKSEGTHLAVADSEEELQFFMKTNKLLWAGVKKVGGAWQTVEGQSYDALRFNGWHPGQPNGDGNCVDMWKDGLYDNDCYATHPFLCEQHLL